MEQKKTYEKPQIVESVKLEAIAGACGAGKVAGGGGACATLIAS